MKNERQVLIIGGSGMVGSQVPFGMKPSSAELDITDPVSIARAIERYRPESIWNLAGFVDVRGCQKDPAAAERLNTEGAKNVAQAAARSQVPLVYLSSCLVFDGAKETPYDERDEAHPKTVYGRTKRGGEVATLEEFPEALVVRTGWLFGGLEHDKRFIRRFIAALQKGETVHATADRKGSPTFVPDLIAHIAQLQGELSGIVHIVNEGEVSYLEVALELKRLLNASADVRSVTQKELDASEPPRGAMEALTSARGVRLRPYAEALAEYCDAV